MDALINLVMPDLDGAACIKEIRAAEPSSRLVILTTLDGEEDIYRRMRAGARA